MSKKKTEDAIPETEQAACEAEVEAAEAASGEPAAAEPAADSALDTLQKQYDDLNDRFMRMAAEYDNFRKRSQREREGVHADAVSHAVKALLPTFDNLERALAVETEDAEYKKGVELTHKQLLDALRSLNVTKIEDDPGTAFDPNLHNAVMHVEDEGFGENEIAEVFQHGFMIDDRVIRHSMVKVAN
ncbi:nucleotide exchange factor GrpE [Intestinibacillus massiliensis]|nr:nucleotide exchange factor GrpE [Intestinibacillus massiliensis]